MYDKTTPYASLVCWQASPTERLTLSGVTVLDSYPEAGDWPEPQKDCGITRSTLQNAKECIFYFFGGAGLGCGGGEVKYGKPKNVYLVKYLIVDLYIDRYLPCHW